MIRLLVWLANVHRRLLPLYLAAIGPRRAYAISGFLARRLLHWLPPIREQIEVNLQSLAEPRLQIPNVREFCDRAIAHQFWNLTDVFLAERILHRGTFERFGGQIPPPLRSRLIDAQQRRKPTILVTAYFGPFDLLPLLLGFNGVRAAALYRPHANAWFDAQRRRLRARSGCELVTIADAIWRLPAVLDAGGTIALVADHHDSGRGVPVTFLGRPTKVSKSIAILAQRFEADVIVAGLRRRGSFRFEFVTTGLIEAGMWAGLDYDSVVTFISRQMVASLEKLVLSAPAQYLWARPRWGADA